MRWIVGHRTVVLGGCFVAVALAAVGVMRLEVDYSVEQVFPTRGPERAIYSTFKESFPKEDTQIAIFWREEAPLDGTAFRDMQTAALLFANAGLFDVTWWGDVEVAAPVTFAGEESLEIRPLIDSAGVAEGALRTVLREHRDDPLFRGVLWNAGQEVVVIYGFLPPELNTDTARRAVEERISDGVAALERDGRTLVLAGIPVVRSRVPKILANEQGLLLAVGLLMLFGLLWVAFRRVSQSLLSLVAILPAYLCTVGVMGYVGTPITILTAFIPLVVLVVGVSDTVHLLTAYREQWRVTQDRTEAVVRAFSDLRAPCFYTSLTTAVGFLSLIGTRIGIVMSFGAFTALAIAFTFAFTMTVLPVLLTSRWAGEPARNRENPPGVAAVVGLAVRSARRSPAPVVVTFMGLLGAAAVFAAALRVDTYLIDDMKDDSEIIRDLRWVEAAGFGLFQVNIFLESSGDEPLHSPATLAWMEDVQRFAEGDPVVVKTLGLPDYLRHLRRAVADPGERQSAALPTTTEEAAQLLFLAELEGSELVRDVYERETDRAQIILVVRDAGSRALGPFLDRVRHRLEQQPPPAGIAQVTGTVTLVQVFTDQLLHSFGPSLLLALVLIYAIMAYMFRSPALGLLTLIPNLGPLIVVAGIMQLSGFALKPSTILVFSVAFGIIVDDTMHLLGRTRLALRRGHNAAQAVEIALAGSGPALVITSVAVTAGLAPLLISQFEILYLLGLMTIVSVVVALLADLFVFPALMRLAARRGRVPSSLVDFEQEVSL